MMFSPMEKVCIISDTLNYGLPTNELGYIIKIDRNADDARTFWVRVPSKQEDWWVPECDLMNYEKWLGESADEAIQETLVNKALETRDKKLFDAVLEDIKR